MTKFVMTINNMKQLIKTARENKGILIRELAQALGIDQALVSKFESGTRKPTRQQVLKLAAILDIDPGELLVQWLKEKILYEIGEDEYALEAMMAAESELKQKTALKLHVPNGIKQIVKQIDTYKKKLDKLREYDSYRIKQALELEYTFESNRIEGNTLSLRETDLVINEGLTISGKSMREHLEAINHSEAIAYIKYLIDKNVEINEREVLSVHNLILRGIDQSNAGKYRNVQVMIKGSAHHPPPPFLVPKQMEELFYWYTSNKKQLHPVVLAAEMHERLVTIHPFIDGNGRTSRLIMNLILLKHGYVIANIKGDTKSRMAYYHSLETVQTGGSKSHFISLIAKYELESIRRYVNVLAE